MTGALNMDEIDRLTDAYLERLGELGISAAVALLDTEQGLFRAGFSTQNVSESVVCAAIVLREIVQAGVPACPHCAVNYRRARKALQAMNAHAPAAGLHLH
jgi:hypothetical protein